MPFGLCNASALFERLMETISVGLTTPASCILKTWLWLAIRSENTCEFYKTEDVRRPPKSQSGEVPFFFQNEVFLSPEGITTDPMKLKAVRQWPTPMNKHEIKSIICLCTCLSPDFLCSETIQRTRGDETSHSVNPGNRGRLSVTKEAPLYGTLSYLPATSI
jgi:hypothetical protein